MTKNQKVSIAIAVLFLALIRLTPIWERNLDNLWTVSILLFIAVLFFWTIDRIVRELFRLASRKANFNLKAFIPVLVMTALFLDGLFNPLRVNLDSLYGNVSFRACYEGTQNQATFKLREGNRFELHWTGAFFANRFYRGTYRIVGDNLHLEYVGEKPPRFGETVLMDNEQELLITVRNERDGLMNVVPFYYGYCKGLN